MFKEEFVKIRKVIMEFWLGSELFKKKVTQSYVTPGVKNEASEELFSRLISFLHASQAGERLNTPDGYFKILEDAEN